MINIVSKQAMVSETTGPQKVYANLLKGLDRIGYPYVVNRDLRATSRLWIQDDIDALHYMHMSNAKIVVGPNLFCLPRDVPESISFSGVLYIQPSDGTQMLWRELGFDRCPFVTWPVGIDTDEFAPSARLRSERFVVVYHKQRPATELQAIEEDLARRRLPYEVIKYGSYTEDQFKRLLDSALLVVWHGRHESQGIAFQEVLSCNVPVVLCDVTCLGDDCSNYAYEPAERSFPATAAPYFDERCGARVTSVGDFSGALDQVLDQLDSLAPREFVMEHLSLDGQARAFVRLWEHYGLTLEGGYDEACRTRKALSAPLHYRLTKVRGRYARAVARRLKGEG